MRSFIHKDVVSIKTCKEIIKYFEKNSKKLSHKGVVNDKKVLLDIKDSTDMSILPTETKKPFGDYYKQIQLCLNNYISIYNDLENLSHFGIVEEVNIQKYNPGGGFKRSHCERGYFYNASRLLVFMTYLNTVKDGGTYFKYQDYTTQAEIGNTYIWPAEWTHMHAGVLTNETKYIITGWFNFIPTQEN